MNDFENPDEPWRDHRDELLEKVTRRGRSLRLRRQATLVTVVVAVLLVPFAAVAATNSRTNVPVLRWASRGADAPAPTTTTSTIAPQTTTTIRSATPTTADSKPPASIPPTSTTTAPGCRRSFDPVCGAFRWDPAPPRPNPLSVSVTAELGEGLAGSFTAHYPGSAVQVEMDFGDGQKSVVMADLAPCEQEPTGAWTWVDPLPAATQSFPHTYAEPGSYVVTVTVTPAPFCNHESAFTPGSATTTIEIGTATTTTTSTTVPTD